MTYSLDRFEKTFAIPSPEDGGQALILPRAGFEGRNEGDVFEEKDGVLVFDSQFNANRKARIGKNSKSLSKKPKSN